MTQSDQQRRPIVLVVDDDHSVLRALGRLIRSAGFDTQLFEHPRHLLETEVPKENACLVLDVYLLEMNGVELSAKLEMAGCRLPRIMITGREDAETDHLLQGVQAVEVLHKPFDEGLLLNAITKAVTASNLPVQ
jgi:FixJ family two-component response regulator